MRSKCVVFPLACFLFAGCGRKAPVDFGAPDLTRSNAVANAASATQVGWTSFRGPDQGRALSTATPPLIWSERTNVLWKTAIPGAGASSPVLLGDRIWLTSSVEDGRSLRVISLDATTGAILGNQEVFTLAARPANHRVNSPASPTPVVDGEHLYVSFGPHGTACLDARDLKVVWTNTELKFDTEDMGPGASLIAVDDIIVVTCDGTDQRYIAGLDKRTGKLRWKTDRSNQIEKAVPFRKSFSTPLRVNLQGVDQILSSSSYRLFGYEPHTGKELWSAEIPGFTTIPVPSVRSDWIFVCTGYNRAELWAFKYDGPGKPLERMWKVTRSIPLVSSPVLVGDLLFLVSQEGIASCIGALDGDIHWNERLGGTFWASPISAKEQIYFCGENGTTTVLAASPEFKVITKNTLDGEIMATPAIVDRALFLRTKENLYRIESKEE